MLIESVKLEQKHENKKTPVLWNSKTDALKSAELKNYREIVHVVGEMKNVSDAGRM